MAGGRALKLCLLTGGSLSCLTQDLEGDEEGEDEEDAESNPKVSEFGPRRARVYSADGHVLGGSGVRNLCWLSSNKET